MPTCESCRSRSRSRVRWEEGEALNITQTSYAGSMELGITADRKARIQRLIDHLEGGLAELELLAGI